MTLEASFMRFVVRLILKIRLSSFLSSGSHTSVQLPVPHTDKEITRTYTDTRDRLLDSSFNAHRITHYY